jgi:hypothetical protein
MRGFTVSRTMKHSPTRGYRHQAWPLADPAAPNPYRRYRRTTTMICQLSASSAPVQAAVAGGGGHHASWQDDLPS